MNGPSLVVGLLVFLVGVASLGVSHASSGAQARRSSPVLKTPEWFRSGWALLDPGRDPDAAWPWAVAAAVVVACGAAAVAPGLIVLGLVGLGAPSLVGRLRAMTALRRPLADLPAAVDALVAALATGASPRRALESAAGGSASADLGRAVRLVERGLPLQAALDRWALAHPRSGAALVADSLALAGRSGGSLVDALRGVGETLRDREAVAREARALATQARLSAVVLVIAPIAFAAAAAALDPAVRRILLETPLGWACLVVGAVLDLIGARWMRAVVDRVGR